MPLLKRSGTRGGGTGRPARREQKKRAFAAKRQAVWFEAHSVSNRKCSMAKGEEWGRKEGRKCWGERRRRKGRLFFRGSLMNSHRVQKTPPRGSGGVSGFWLHENSASGRGLLMARAYLWPVRERTAKLFRYNARCPGFRHCVGREKGDFLSEDSIFMSSVATWRPFSEARHC